MFDWVLNEPLNLTHLMKSELPAGPHLKSAYIADPKQNLRLIFWELIVTNNWYKKNIHSGGRNNDLGRDRKLFAYDTISFWNFMSLDHRKMHLRG